MLTSMHNSLLFITSSFHHCHCHSFFWTYYIDTVDTRVSRYFQNQKNVFFVREKRAQFTPVHGVMVPVNTQELLFFSSAQI